MEEPWRVRLLVGLWLFWQRLRSGDLEGHILGFYCAEAPPAELKSLNVYKVYFCSMSSSLFPNKYQANINMCTTAPLPSWSRPFIIEENFFCVWILVASPSFAFLIQTTYNCGEVFFLCKLWSPPLPLPPWSSPFTIEENRKFSFCVNFGRLLWYVATLLTSVKLCRTSEDKLRDWDKRDMTYKHLYQFHSLTSDRIGW